jgi:hypothetical protein
MCVSAVSTCMCSHPCTTHDLAAHAGSCAELQAGLELHGRGEHLGRRQCQCAICGGHFGWAPGENMHLCTLMLDTAASDWRCTL